MVFMVSSFKGFCVTLGMTLGLLQGAAHAQTVAQNSKSLLPVIEITAEYYPRETYQLGLELNADHSLNRVYYENNEKQKRFYSMEELKNRVVLMKTVDSGKVYNLVYLSVNPGMKKDEYKFTISYMRNGLLKNMTAMTQYLLQFNKTRQSYDLLDIDSQRLISRAYVKTNFWFGKAVGIDEVITN